MSDSPGDNGRRVAPAHVRVLRLGHGANCSSVGSVIDTLFATAVVGGALFAAVAAALGNEEVTVVGAREADDDATSPREDAGAEDAGAEAADVGVPDDDRGATGRSGPGGAP